MPFSRVRSLHLLLASLRRAPQPLSHAFTVLVALVALLGSGCALLASANAAHSHITPCVRDPSFAVVDFGLAGASTGAVILTDAVDDSVAWMLAPATFVSSGLIGAISADRCRKRARRVEAAAPIYRPVEPPAAPTLPAATPEDLGLVPADPAAPPVNLRLDPSFDPSFDPSSGPSSDPATTPNDVAGETDTPPAGSDGSAPPPSKGGERAVPGPLDTVPCGPTTIDPCPEPTRCRETVDRKVRCAP
jgi:hypothetical protein